MKKLFFIFVFGIQFSFAGQGVEKLVIFNSNEKKLDPVACCTRRAASGTYGQSNYNQVSVQRCATSSSSYQDAYAKACTLAEASAERALAIAQTTSQTVTIGG